MIKVLSLFDGMSCGQIALRELGVVCEYYASEIDKYAVRQSSHVFPDTIHLGDVTKWREWDIDWGFDLVLAGSPCQGFSFAGKQLAFDDPRSALFFVFADILEHIRKHNPNVKFLLENVKMKKEHEAVITNYVGVKPVQINSALVSAQNRKRLYWCNFGVERQVDLFTSEVFIPRPKDRGVMLRDILEDEVPEKYYINNKAINRVFSKNYSTPQINPDKTGCLNTTNNSSKLSFDSGTAFIVASRGRNPENPKSRESGLNTEQMLEPRFDGKTNCLTGVQKDNLVFTKNYVQWDTSGKGYKSQQDRAHYDSGKMCSVPAGRTENKINVLVEDKIRRLTPTECARLQTVPEWYEWVVSDTQIYRMLGNGWTVEVIKHILSFAGLK